MDEKLKDILSNLNPGVDQATLLQYLQGKLSAEQQHEVEKSFIESDFESDALEGLSSVKDKKQVMFIVDQLNRDLKKKTEKKKERRNKLQLNIEPWLIIVVITVLALVVLSYIVIHLMLR